jgi:hypothetical protein
MAARIADKVQGNFCDYFRPGTAAASAAPDQAGAARAKLDALFKKDG